MRALKLVSTVLLAAIAVTAGLFVAAAVVVFGLVALLVAKLLGRGRVRITMPHFQRRTQPRAASVSPRSGDAIEVTATEVAGEAEGALSAGSEESDRLRA